MIRTPYHRTSRAANYLLVVTLISNLCPQRATAGLRRPAAELTDGSQGNASAGNSNPVNDTSNPVQPTDRVAMEISSSPPMTELERENIVGWQSEDAQELHYPEDGEMAQPMREQLEEEEAGADGGECDYLVFEIGEKQERKSDEERMERAEEEGDGEASGGGDVGRREEEERETVEENEAEDPWEDDTCQEGKEEEEDGGTMGPVEAEAVAEALFLPDGASSSSPPEQPMESKLPEEVEEPDEPGLQAQLALVSSDSEVGEEQPAAAAELPHEVGGDGENREEEEEEQGRGAGEEGEEPEEPREEEFRRSCREDDRDEDQGTSRSGVFVRSPSFSSTASSIDPDKRVRPLTGGSSLATPPQIHLGENRKNLRTQSAGGHLISRSFASTSGSCRFLRPTRHPERECVHRARGLPPGSPAMEEDGGGGRRSPDAQSGSQSSGQLPGHPLDAVPSHPQPPAETQVGTPGGR